MKTTAGPTTRSQSPKDKETKKRKASYADDDPAAKRPKKEAKKVAFADKATCQFILESGKRRGLKCTTAPLLQRDYCELHTRMMVNRGKGKGVAKK